MIVPMSAAITNISTPQKVFLPIPDDSCDEEFADVLHNWFFICQSTTTPLRDSSESGSLIACFRYNSGQLLSFSSERNSFRLEIAVRFLVLSKLMISYTALLPILFRFSSMFAIIFPNDHVMGSKVFNS